MPRLLAIDANSLTHRGFHSVLRQVTDVAHVSVNDVSSAVANMIASTWKYGPYDHLVLAFDHPRNARRDVFPEYKGQRAPTPQPVKDALDDVRQVFAAAHVPVFRDEGAEADDLLAAVVDITEHAGIATDVLSSDRDLIALVDTHTRLLRPQASFATLRIETSESVRARYGIEPWQYPEFAALRGDPADGLDGVRGIGEKTAAQLVNRYHTVLGVYDHLDVLPPRLEAALRRDRELVERNLMLMAPRTRLNVTKDTVPGDPVQLTRLAEVLEQRGLSDAARRFRRAGSGAVAPPKAPGPEHP